MAIGICRANLESDRTELIDLLRENLNISFEVGEARYDWLYLKSAHGQALVWKALDSSTGRIVGAGAAFPRTMFFDGSEIRGFVFGDFCIEQAYRSVGPSLQLQRACLGALEQPGYSFIYDFPSAGMMAIYRRLGIEQSDSFVRWALPLRVEQRLAQHVPSKWLTRALSAPINTALALRSKRRNKTTYEFEVFHDWFGPEFCLLNDESRSRAGICTDRSADYLNWRYRSCPLVSYQCLAARKAGTLIGYAIYTVSPEVSSIVDVCCSDDPELVIGLLRGVAGRVRAAGGQTVSLVASNAHPWKQQFESAGFRKRETSTVVVKTAPHSLVSSATFSDKWFAMNGERDS